LAPNFPSLTSLQSYGIARALNNRLKTVVNRLAQKGFNNLRYIQEVLINVIECENNY
jgi:hypothetical protein